MKLTILMMLGFVLMANARSHAQSLTLNLRDVALEKVFSEIKKQTGYRFIAAADAMKQAPRVTVQVKDASLDQVLSTCLANTSLAYEIDGKTIVIRRKAAQPAESKLVQMGVPPVDVRGRVLNENGEPVLATVAIKGSNRATSTNADGYFELKGVDENAVLVITAANIETREIAVSSKMDVVSVKMKIESMNEVLINKGYYTEKQRYSISNVGKVTAKEIEKQPVTNPLLALQGRVPGLFINQSSGVPGGGVNVRLQGQSGIRTAGGDPLYIIDGVPFTSQLLPNLGAILGRSGAADGNPLSFINPADIESIEVLKDADATAIYGSRAANGVILITTKRGASTTLRTEIRAQQGFGKITRKVNVLELPDYLSMRREALRNDGIQTPGASDYDLNGFWDTTRSTDWQKELIGGTACYTDIQANLSGGTKYSQYRIGSGFHRETTVFPGSFRDVKGSLNIFLRATSINQRFEARFSGSTLFDDNKLINEDPSLISLNLAPNAPALYTSDRSLNWMSDGNGNSTWTNPLASRTNTYSVKTLNQVANMYLSYKVLEGLKLASTFGYTGLNADETQLWPLVYYAPELRPVYQRFGFYGKYKISTWIAEPQLHFEKSVKELQLEAFVGTTFQSTTKTGQQLQGTNYNNDLVIADIKSAGVITANSTLESIYKYNAVFGRFNAHVKERYIVNLTARRDGSSRFGPKNKFSNFGSVGVGWIFTEENFAKPLSSFLSFGKLRINYGRTGNDQIDDYQFLNLYRPTTTPFPYQGTTGLIISSLHNPYIQWEQTDKFQSGLDLSFFGEALNLSATYFRNVTSNQLLTYSLPIITGFTGITENFPATVVNRGWEFNLNASPVRRKSFTWAISANFTKPVNELASFPNIAATPYATQLIVGQPVNIQFLYQYLGVNPNTGLFQYSDGKQGITTRPDTSELARFLIFNPNPSWFGGLQNSISVGSIDLSFLLQFTKQQGPSNSYGSFPGRMGANQPALVLDRWTKPGDNATFQKFNSNFATAPSYSPISGSTLGYSDASFVRLKNLSLSYNLSASASQKIHASSVKVFVQGQNLLTVTSYKGFDPETRSNANLPPLKVLTAGLQLVF